MVIIRVWALENITVILIYRLWFGQKLITFQSTDLGIAFLIEDQEKIIYHAGDLNDWV